MNHGATPATTVFAGDSVRHSLVLPLPIARGGPCGAFAEVGAVSRALAAVPSCRSMTIAISRCAGFHYLLPPTARGETELCGVA